MYELDLSGYSCPIPVLKTKKFLADMPTGFQVKVITTDPASVIDLQEFCKKTGHKLIEQTVNNNIILTLIEHR